MARDPKLTEEIKKELLKLELELKKCIKVADFDMASKYMTSIQNLLKPKGYNSRLMKNKNYFFEVALEAGKLEYAISGLTGVRDKVSTGSRMFLESTAILAICYIRKGDLKKAQTFIDETIRNINNITSDDLRRSFHKSFLNRVDNEVLLNSLKDTAESLDVDEVHGKSIELIQTKTEDEIYEILGTCIPDSVIKLLATSQKHNLLLISTSDRICLPPPISEQKKKVIGMKVSSAIKRVVWKSLCDPDNEIYKAWSQGLSIVHDKKYISGAIVCTLANWKIGTSLMAASICALAIRFGVGVFCEIFEPETIMEQRVN